MLWPPPGAFGLALETAASRACSLDVLGLGDCAGAASEAESERLASACGTNIGADSGIERKAASLPVSP